MRDKLDILLARSRAARARSVELRVQLKGRELLSEQLSRAAIARGETRVLVEESRELGAVRSDLVREQRGLIGKAYGQRLPSDDS